MIHGKIMDRIKENIIVMVAYVMSNQCFHDIEMCFIYNLLFLCF